jgi:hypothetical protein
MGQGSSHSDLRRTFGPGKSGPNLTKTLILFIILWSQLNPVIRDHVIASLKETKTGYFMVT